MDDRHLTIILGFILCAMVLYWMPPNDAKEIIQMIVSGIFGMVTGSALTVIRNRHGGDYGSRSLPGRTAVDQNR